MADRSVLVRLRADVSDFVAKSQLAKAAVRDLHNEIDKSNDRTAWLAQGILALVPAVTRLGAGAVPVISGIATQLTVGALAAGTALLAFNGIGDALGALNEYQLEPTEANLAKLNETMAKIGPDGQALVEFLDSLGPAFSQLANSARGGIFPGVIDGIEEFMTLAPRLNTIVREVGEGIGELTSQAGEGLASDRYEDFFEYLETRAKPILVEMGQSLGNFITGLANMMVAFDPLTDDFSKGLLDMSRSFREWSEGLSGSTGFQEFLDYVQDAGPAALDFLGAFISALVQLAEAAAPVGAVMLPVLTSMLNVVGDLASTPLGPLALGFLSLTAAWGRLNAVAAITGSGVMAKATAGIRSNVEAARAGVPTLRQFGNAAAFAITPTTALTKSMESQSKAASSTAASALNARGQVREFGRAAAPVAGQVALLALAMSDVDDKMGLTNTTSLALAGSLLGPWGAAVGGASGLLLDMKAGADAASEGFRGLDAAVDTKNIEVLTQRIAEAKAELADQDEITGFGDFFSDAMRDLSIGGAGEGITDVYTREIEKAEAELTELKNTRADVAADKTLYNSIQAETAVLEANIQAMREKRAEAIRGLNAELDYKGSILDARDALKENGRTVDENTRAGQANLSALYGMAAAWNQQDDATKASKENLRAAKDEFIRVAEAMGMGEDKAKRLAKRLFELPAKVPIEIGVDYETAMQHIRAVKSELESIKDEDVYINVRKVNASGFGPQATTSADGGSVPKTGLPYADRHLYVLADGEEIISNRHGQADQYRRDRASGRIPGYADGGTTGKPPKRGVTYDSSSSGAFSAAQLQAMIAAAEAQENAAGQQADAARIAALAAQDQLDAAEKGAQAAEDNLRAVEQQADSFRNSVAGKFSSALTGGGLAGLQQNVSRDTSAGASMDATLRALVASGLDASSALYKELAASEDQQTANELLAAGPQMIAAMQQQVADRDAVNEARADAAREASFGPLIAQGQAALDAANTQVAWLQQNYNAAQGRAAQLDNRLAGLTDQVANLASQIADRLNDKVSGNRR